MKDKKEKIFVANKQHKIKIVATINRGVDLQGIEECLEDSFKELDELNVIGKIILTETCSLHHCFVRFVICGSEDMSERKAKRMIETMVMAAHPAIKDIGHFWIRCLM